MKDDIREARFIHRLLRLGGELPAERWQQIDVLIDRMLASDGLSPRDVIRIGQLQAARERVIATAVSKALDRIPRDQPVTASPGSTSIQIIEVDDYYGSEAAMETAQERSLPQSG